MISPFFLRISPSKPQTTSIKTRVLRESSMRIEKEAPYCFGSVIHRSATNVVGPQICLPPVWIFMEHLHKSQQVSMSNLSPSKIRKHPEKDPLLNNSFTPAPPRRRFSATSPRIENGSSRRLACSCQCCFFSSLHTDSSISSRSSSRPCQALVPSTLVARPSARSCAPCNTLSTWPAERRNWTSGRSGRSEVKKTGYNVSKTRRSMSMMMSYPMVLEDWHMAHRLGFTVQGLWWPVMDERLQSHGLKPSTLEHAEHGTRFLKTSSCSSSSSES